MEIHRSFPRTSTSRCTRLYATMVTGRRNRGQGGHNAFEMHWVWQCMDRVWILRQGDDIKSRVTLRQGDHIKTVVILRQGVILRHGDDDIKTGVG